VANWKSRLFGALGGGGGANRGRAEGDRARDARDWPAAAAAYRGHLAERPDDFAIWVQLGHALKEAGDLAGAEEAYARALALQPRDADLLLNMGHLAKLRGDWPEAAYRYRASYRLEPGDDARRELMADAIEPHLDAAEARLAAERRAR
jgi:O-antigen biosynthesis protein